jgi:hypothetical protein
MKLIVDAINVSSTTVGAISVAPSHGIAMLNFICRTRRMTLRGSALPLFSFEVTHEAIVDAINVS